MYTMPSTPLTCSSMGAATVSRTVVALAPGYTVVTNTAGGVTFGYCVIGKVNTAVSLSAPACPDLPMNAQHGQHRQDAGAGSPEQRPRQRNDTELREQVTA